MVIKKHMHTNAKGLEICEHFYAVYRLESWRMGDGGTYELVKYIPLWTELVKLRYGNCIEH